MTGAQAVLNVPELLTRVEDDRELLRELVLIFKKEWPEQMETLRQSIRAGEPQGIANAGHSFKGMLSNLAAPRAAAAAARLEQLGHAGGSEEVGAAFSELQKEIRLLLPELESCAAETMP